MNNKTLLQKYIKIECGIHSNKIKQRLIKELVAEFKSSGSIPSFEDIQSISIQLIQSDTKIHLDFFDAILYPTIKKEIESENFHAIKLLLQFNTSLVKFIDKTYSSYDLLKKGLSINPNDIDLLTIFKNNAQTYIQYTIHEVPAGVLYANTGITAEKCDDLIEYLEEYKDACSKLNIADSELIQKAESYYHSYKNYLLNKDKYEDFEHYLRVQY
ncbi:MAG TPA: hypothetical protein VK796_04650 [Cytophaga sp.]|nr:hypothetical protein [Cytophaga sp.]